MNVDIDIGCFVPWNIYTSPNGAGFLDVGRLDCVVCLGPNCNTNYCTRTRQCLWLCLGALVNLFDKNGLCDLIPRGNPLDTMRQ